MEIVAAIREQKVFSAKNNFLRAPVNKNTVEKQRLEALLNKYCRVYHDKGKDAVAKNILEVGTEAGYAIEQKAALEEMSKRIIEQIPSLECVIAVKPKVNEFDDFDEHQVKRIMKNGIATSILFVGAFVYGKFFTDIPILEAHLVDFTEAAVLSTTLTLLVLAKKYYTKVENLIAPMLAASFFVLTEFIQLGGEEASTLIFGENIHPLGVFDRNDIIAFCAGAIFGYFLPLLSIISKKPDKTMSEKENSA